MNPLKSTNWLSENIGKVKILDATWHMPNLNRNAFEEFLENHIEGSIFFDLDANSNKKNSLPHMLPELHEWEKIVSNLAGNIVEIIRKNKDFDLGLFESKLKLSEFIYENQKLLQRPILFYKKKYWICRPPEKALEILGIG